MNPRLTSTRFKSAFFFGATLVMLVACSVPNKSLDEVDMDLVRQNFNVSYDDGKNPKATDVEAKFTTGDGADEISLKFKDSKGSVTDNSAVLQERLSTHYLHKHTFSGRVLSHEFIFTARDGITRHTNRVTMPTADFVPGAPLVFSVGALQTDFSFLGDAEKIGDELYFHILQDKNSARFAVLTASNHVSITHTALAANHIEANKPAVGYWERKRRFELSHRTARGGAITTNYLSEKKGLTLIR